MTNNDDDTWRHQENALKQVFQDLYMERISEEQAAKRIQCVCSIEFVSTYLANAFSRGWINRFNVGISEAGEIL